MLADIPQNELLQPFRSPQNSFEDAFWSKNEAVILGIVLVSFLAICLVLHTRYIPWNDEVQFVEPAANLYYGHGFVSRAHSNENDQIFWSANAPGYSTLLYLTFVTFHFSETVARYLNLGMMALAALLLWHVVRRAGFLADAKTRLLLVVLLLTGYGGYLCYANIRYEAFCLLQCVVALLAYFQPRAVIRNISLSFLGVVAILTNLQLPEYAVALALLLTIAFSRGFSLIWRLRFLYLGHLIGGVLLFLLYAGHPGALNAFRITLQQQVGDPLLTKLRNLPDYLQYDPSLITIVVLLIGALFIIRRRPDRTVRSSIVAGLLICTVLPIAFFLIRRYVFSFVWMVYVPALICLCRVLEAKVSVARLWRTLVALGCVVAAGSGLPKAALGIITDWNVRNYSTVEAFVTANIRKQDITFCESAAYFVAKRRALRVYSPGYLEVINTDEKRSLTLLIVNPDNESDVLRIVGGSWNVTAHFASESKSSAERLLPLTTNFSCRLDVLRRTVAPETSAMGIGWSK